MAEEIGSRVEALGARDLDEPDSIVVRANPFGAMARAAGSTASLALVSLIVATATMLNMSVAYDIADAKLFSSRGVDNLASIRWAAGTRVALAVIAFVLAIIAGIRYARDLPATRFTFSADGEEATETAEGAAAPGWVTLLVGSAVVISVLALVLNAVVLVLTLHLHESPNFGVPTG